MNAASTITTSRRPASSGLARLVCLLFVGFLVGQDVAPATAQSDPALELGQPYQRNGILSFDLELTHLFDDETAEALTSGLPATVIVQWGIWRKRKAWWDDEIVSGSTSYRVFYDVLEQRYDAFDRTGRPLASSDDLGEIEHALCRRRGLTTVRIDRLEPETSYVIEVLARLEPLDEQDISNLEAWARGGRSDKTFLSSVSRRTIGWLKNLVGPGIRSAWARSESFVLEDIFELDE
ncbi:MAG: DUF4390 domain-containing protein [Gemmatimonadales bacterium]|nr:DUF4390 domain-containing protein [Gemmatimonadales bacterium]